MLLEQRLVHGAQQNKDTDQDDDPGDGAGQDIDGCFHQGITGHDGVCAAEVGLTDDAQNQTEDHGRAVELAGGEDEADEAVRLRRYDDLAKVPGAPTAGLAHFSHTMSRVALAPQLG